LPNAEIQRRTGEAFGLRLSFLALLLRTSFVICHLANLSSVSAFDEDGFAIQPHAAIRQYHDRSSQNVPSA